MSHPVAQQSSSQTSIFAAEVVETGDAKKAESIFSNMVVALFIVSVCFCHLDQGTLRVDAIRYAWLSLQVAFDGALIDFVGPYSGTAYVNKPPLLFWLVGSFYSFAGVGTFSSKFIPALFAAAALLIVLAALRTKIGLRKATLVVISVLLCPTFFQDLLDLNLEGIVLFGLVLCGLSQNYDGWRAQVLLIVGSCFIALTKAPYLLFVLLGLLLSKLSRTDFRTSISVLVSLLPAFLLYALWLVLTGEARAQAIGNQLEKPFVLEDGYLSNFFGWLKVLLIQFFPFNIVCFVVLKGMQRREWSSSFGFWLMMSLPLVVLSVDSRARYLYPALVGILFWFSSSSFTVHKSCDASRTSDLSAKERTVLLSLSLAIWLVFSSFSIPAHREDPFVAASKEKDFAALFDSELIICVQAGSKSPRAEKRQRGLIRRTELVLMFYGVPFAEVVGPSRLLQDEYATRSSLLDASCARALGEKGLSASPLGSKLFYLEA